MKILLSIKPEFVEKIFNGEKKFEYRKKIPKAPKITTVVIYATRPVGKVVGEFCIDKILSAKPINLWSLTSEFAGISKSLFNEYFQGCQIAYAIKIRKAYKYPQPLNLTTILTSGIAPQNFCYLK